VWGVGGGVLGVGLGPPTPNPQSPIPNPQSPIPIFISNLLEIYINNKYKIILFINYLLII